MAKKSWKDLEATYGAQSKGDGILQRRCRLLQSWYRVTKLKEPEYGPFRTGGRSVGSTLVNGENSRSNFISKAAFAYANERVSEKARNRDLTIDEYRLFNNMLSSQPMCFNLFADLREGLQKGDQAATDVIKSMFAEAPIETIERVEVEMIPTPIKEYINDKSAFDAAILFSTKAKGKGIIAIETKYTDSLGKNRASDESIKHEVSKALKVFNPKGQRHIDAAGFNQLTRNVLLMFAYANKHSLDSVTSYVLALEEDEEAKREVDLLKSMLSPGCANCIQIVSLEAVVARGLKVATDRYASVLRKFHSRYLDLSVADKLLSDF